MADAIQYGRCANKNRCSLAYNRQIVFVPLDGNCPECGQPLDRNSLNNRRLKVLPLLLVLALLGGGGYYAKTRFLDPPPGPGPTAAPTATPLLADATPIIPRQPPADSPPFEALTATPASTRAPSGPRATPGASAAPVFPTDPPPRGGLVDQPNFAPDNAANVKAKRDVLLRIQQMPRITEEQKVKLITAVKRARNMGCIFIVPFEGGKKTVGPREADILARGFQSAGIRQLMDDPTLVFVVLGYADKQGDPATNERVSLERAQSVLAVMQQRCGVQNVTYGVGMGGSDLFDAKSASKNRLVEIWAAFP